MAGASAQWVRFTDLDGKVHEEDAEGPFATCIQHEIDHLNGVVRGLSVEVQARPRASCLQSRQARGGVGFADHASRHARACPASMSF
jgi:hypothetical protein